MVTIVKKSKVGLLTKTLAVVSILAPTSGHTLGIGEIKLHSALNQNLDAEISLTLSGESISDIKVSLATPDKFDKAGVSWSYFLSKIKFETITHSNGSTVIKLTSKEALKEPFLDFLLEVSWPKGNLYREFTVLVDPPSVYNPATLSGPAGTDSYSQSSVATSQRQTYANGQISKDEYGPTLANDTLWSVAERARGQEDVSVEQMMLAIYEANPDAFYKGNVYALTTGKILKIPGKEAVLKLSRNQALAEFNRHTKAWRVHAAPAHADTAKQKPAPGKVEETVPNKVEKSLDNQLKLVAPTKAAVDGQVVVGSVNEQAKTEKKPGKVPSVTTETVKGKPVPGVTELAETGAASAGQPESSIQNRLAELEKQLVMMQQMIALKDQQLAALQSQIKTSGGDKAQTAVVQTPVIKPVEPVPPVTKPVEQVIPVIKPVIEKPVEPVQSLPQVKPVQPVQPVVQTEPEGFDLYYLGAGGAGTLILSLLGWLWWRKRKVDEQMNTESMFASSTLIKVPGSFDQDESKSNANVSVPVDDESGDVHDVGTVGESSFLSEFTPSDFDSFDTDQGEIDPISEADVYLAYGRYQQAEELIRQAIRDQPNRDECKLKLLEIFYANEDNAAFEAYASELAKSGKCDDVGFWEKAAEMGGEICPDSPLFSSKSEQSVAELQDNQGFDLNVSSFDKEPKVLDQSVTAPDIKLNKAPEAKLEEIDFDLSSFSMEPEEAEQSVTAPDIKLNKAPEAKLEEIDFDLNSFSMQPEAAVQPVVTSGIKPGKVAEAPSGLDDVDFDLSSFSMDVKEQDEVEETISASGKQMDNSTSANAVNEEPEFESYEFDFGSGNVESTAIDDFDFSGLETTQKTGQDIDFSGDNSLDLNDDFDFNFDMPASSPDQEFGVSDLTDMDELETKLDLAKAYVDMGDADAAKDLAREVLEQGNAEQKKAAQALLDELE